MNILTIFTFPVLVDFQQSVTKKSSLIFLLLLLIILQQSVLATTLTASNETERDLNRVLQKQSLSNTAAAANHSTIGHQFIVNASFVPQQQGRGGNKNASGHQPIQQLSAIEGQEDAEEKEEDHSGAIEQPLEQLPNGQENAGNNYLDENPQAHVIQRRETAGGNQQQAADQIIDENEEDVEDLEKLSFDHRMLKYHYNQLAALKEEMERQKMDAPTSEGGGSERYRQIFRLHDITHKLIADKVRLDKHEKEAEMCKEHDHCIGECSRRTKETVDGQTVGIQTTFSCPWYRKLPIFILLVCLFIILLILIPILVVYLWNKCLRRKPQSLNKDGEAEPPLHHGAAGNEGLLTPDNTPKDMSDRPKNGRQQQWMIHNDSEGNSEGSSRRGDRTTQKDELSTSTPTTNTTAGLGTTQLKTEGTTPSSLAAPTTSSTGDSRFGDNYSLSLGGPNVTDGTAQQCVSPIHQTPEIAIGGPNPSFWMKLLEKPTGQLGSTAENSAPGDEPQTLDPDTSGPQQGGPNDVSMSTADYTRPTNMEKYSWVPRLFEKQQEPSSMRRTTAAQQEQLQPQHYIQLNQL